MAGHTKGGALRRLTIVLLLVAVLVLLHRFAGASELVAPSTLLAFGFVVLASYAIGQLVEVVRLPHITGYLLAGMVLGPSFAVARRTIYRCVFAMCLLAALVLACPALPLPTSLVALAALAASIVIPVHGQQAFNWPRWWEAYSTVLVAMLVVGLLTARRGRWGVGYFAGLTILAGYSRLLREEVVVTTHGGLGALLLTLLVSWLAARWPVRSPAAAAAIWPVLRRTVIVGALFYAGLAALSIASAPPPSAAAFNCLARPLTVTPSGRYLRAT